MDPTGIDLFAGAGGFSLGMRMAGIKVLAAVEIDKWAAATYRYNHKDTIMIEEDIRKITSNRLLKTVNLKKGELGILFGGPPCQGFTTISKSRSLDDPRSKLMYEFIRMTKGIQPRIFYIENVPGLFAYKDFFIFLMEPLEKCGYVVRCLMMDAVSYGVPQSSALVNKCFAMNGFPKEEVKDLYWNKTMRIQMNRKTAADVFDRAAGELFGELLGQGIKRIYKQGKSRRVHPE